VFARIIMSLALSAAFASTSSAQQFDRRARDEPEVAIEAGGRVGTCDVLAFSPDGNFLLAAGDDKVVRVWPHSATGLDTTPGKASVLRWRAWRDQLGGVKALAVSPDGKRIAIGGYGLKISTVAILDRATGNTLAITWPRVAEGVYHDAVTAVGFSPDGKRVGFGTADGTLWLWTPEKLAAPEGDRVWNAPSKAGRFTLPAAGLNFPRCIHFPDANTLVSVAHAGQVLACDLRAKLTDDPDAAVPTATTLFTVNDGEKAKHPIHLARWTADGKWLVAATGRLVLLRSADGKATHRVELPVDHFARSVAVHPRSGTLAVGVGAALPAVAGQPRFYMEGNDELWLYEDATGEKPEPKKLPHTGRVEALAAHPTLDQLAVAGGDSDEITLLDLADTKKPVSIVRGSGRHLHSVNLAQNGDLIAVRTGRDVNATDPNQRGSGPWVRFNIPRFRATADATTKWVDPRITAGGWKIVPDIASRFVWHAERAKPDGGKDSLRLGLDSDLDQAPTCFTFLPDIDGKPSRVLVGHYYGCSLFELVPDRVAKNPRTGIAELPRTKLFIGHGAEVRSVVTDAKGTWFVTASADQTVAAWSLADWEHEAALGAAFAVEDGKLVVGAVDVGSPAWEAGLSKGDRIELLSVDGKAMFDCRAKKPAVGTPEAAVTLLGKPQSGLELFFGWTTATGERRGTPTRLKQRPLWKWFPTFDDRGQLRDSVLWMWHGSYYYTGSVHGDRLIGWHVNAATVTGTPEFHPLERFKHLFLRADVISKLVGTRSVADALKEAWGDNPVRKSFREVEPPPVELALKEATVRKEGLSLAVAVNPLGTNPDMQPERVELWLNDHRYKVWAGPGAKQIAADVVIPPTAFRAGENQLTLIALNPLRGRAEVTRFVHNPAESVPPTLHGLAAGIDDYSGHRKAVAGARAFGDLTLARADATSFSRELLTFQGKGKHFPAGDLTLMLDADAGRGKLLDTLTALKLAGVKPDDLLVVFLAGHGDLLAPPGKGPPVGGGVIVGRGLPADGGKFVFCGPDYSPTKPGTTALSGEELFDALADINCRKLVLLDACRAGGVVETNLLRRCIPNGQGPVVFAACDQSELSFEDDKLGHGVFTYAVLEAFGKKFRAADTNSDGKLSAAELYDYLSDRVPAVVRELRPGNTQNPICFPHPKELPKGTLLKR